MKFVEMVCTSQLKVNMPLQIIILIRFVNVFRSSSAPTDEHTQGNSHVTEKQVLRGDLQIPKDAILFFKKSYYCIVQKQSSRGVL